MLHICEPRHTEHSVVITLVGQPTGLGTKCSLCSACWEVFLLLPFSLPKHAGIVASAVLIRREGDGLSLVLMDAISGLPWHLRCLVSFLPCHYMRRAAYSLCWLASLPVLLLHVLFFFFPFFTSHREDFLDVLLAAQNFSLIGIRLAACGA